MSDPEAELLREDPIEQGIVPVRTPTPEADPEGPYHQEGPYRHDDDPYQPRDQTPEPRSLSPMSDNTASSDHYPPDEETTFPVADPSPEPPPVFLEPERSPDTPPLRNRKPPSESPANTNSRKPRPEISYPILQEPLPNNNTPQYPANNRLSHNKTPERQMPVPFPVANSVPEPDPRSPVGGMEPVARSPLARSASTLAGRDDDKLSNRNTILSYRTDRTTRTLDPETKAKAKKLYRSALTHLLCGLYAMVLIVLGLVFSISSALTYEDRHQDSFYLQVFQLYLFTVSLLFLCYLNCCLLRYRKSPPSGSLRRVNLVSNNVLDQQEKCSGDYNREVDFTSTLSKDKRSRSHSHSEFEDVLDTLSHAVHHVTFDAEGINFYLRLGAIAFGTGSMIHDGFRVASLFDNGIFSLDCRGPVYVAVALGHMVFTFFQTFYIFKNHKIVVNRHKAFVRFGFMHMVATNICTWCMTTVTETAEDIRHLPGEQMPEFANASVNNFTAFQQKCMDTYLRSLAYISSPYLYPCTIEYSLIGAAVIYRMYNNVGRVAKHTIGELDGTSGQLRMDCHKANKGLFLGILVAILTLIAVSCFFVFDQQLFAYEAGTLIFFCTELVLLFLSCSVVVVGFARMQKLRYVHDSEAGKLDMVLLIVAFFGICFLNTFITISSVTSLLPFDLMALLSLCTALLAFVQSLLQTIFIMDGLRRCARSEHHVHTKPGRALVTFLLLCNLSLWVVNTFEVMKAESIPMHNNHFGIMPWSMISHLCIPLLIFFRFHSTVCLSDIWVNAYKLKKKDT